MVIWNEAQRGHGAHIRKLVGLTKEGLSVHGGTAFKATGRLFEGRGAEGVQGSREKHRSLGRDKAISAGLRVELLVAAQAVIYPHFDRLRRL